jgi:hypothetical protein
MSLHNLVPLFDRGPGMPYVERNFRRAQTYANPEAWLQTRTE